MKAISPVIATLILIAIAVIAGVFVLRQFLSFASTSGQQDVLAIQDAYLTVQHNTGGSITVYLQIGLKNQGDKVIKVKNITVAPKTEGLLSDEVTIRPGTTWSQTLLVGTFDTPTDISTWESGTEHLVTVKYDVIGGNSDQVVSTRVRAV